MARSPPTKMCTTLSAACIEMFRAFTGENEQSTNPLSQGRNWKCLFTRLVTQRVGRSLSYGRKDASTAGKEPGSINSELAHPCVAASPILAPVDQTPHFLFRTLSLALTRFNVTPSTRIEAIAQHTRWSSCDGVAGEAGCTSDQLARFTLQRWRRRRRDSG